MRYDNKRWHEDTSAVHGSGAFASRYLKSGMIVGLAFYETDPLTRVVGEQRPDQIYRRTRLGALVNHSESGNLRLEQRGRYYFFVSKCEIKSGEELLIDYKDFPWEGKRDFFHREGKRGF